MNETQRIENPDAPKREIKEQQVHQIEEPKSTQAEREKNEGPTWETVQAHVITRKMDSDDTIRLRGEPMKVQVIDGKIMSTVDAGLMMKLSIVLGIKSCPFFSDIIDESKGVTEEIYARRMTREFRQIPVDLLENIFLKVRESNKRQFDRKDLKKG